MTASFQTLPEFEGNPFIEGLGPIPDLSNLLDVLRQPVTRSASELRLPGYLRRYCALRLVDWVEPLNRQTVLAERIGMIIRRGYVSRNPLSGGHKAALLDASDRLAAGVLGLPAKRFRSCAFGFVLLGHPGMGKSLTVEKSLMCYPQVLRPDLPSTVVQLVWLKVELPSKGSELQLALAILAAIDKVLGSTYVKELAGKNAADMLLLHVQHLMQLHAVGVLVIDELQHLKQSKSGRKVLMNFLVTLVNVVGVPVVLVGTMSAKDIIQEDFREARRGTGLGSPIWERLEWTAMTERDADGSELPVDSDWADFLMSLWDHQWTLEGTTLDEDISATIYDLTQGIVDLVVKLFVLAQFRAIALEEVSGAPVPISADLLRATAAEEFKLVQPMLDALRSDNPSELDRYADLARLNRHVGDVLARGTAVSVNDIRIRLARRSASAEPQAMVGGGSPKVEMISAALSDEGFGADVVRRIVDETVRLNPSGDMWTMLDTARSLAQPEAPSPAGRKKRCKTSRSAVAEPSDPDDLRVANPSIRALRAAARSELVGSVKDVIGA